MIQRLWSLCMLTMKRNKLLKKRKIDKIRTLSQDQISPQIIQQTMDMETNTENNNSQNILIKLN